MKPKAVVEYFRENQNKNKTLKSLFVSQFLGKFEMDELEGMKKSIEDEMAGRHQAVIDEKIEYLKSMGYSVAKED